MTTIRDVAALARTSTSAVSAVLSGGRHNIRVGAGTQARIRAAATQLNYVANPVARSLATRKTGVLGLVFPYSGAFIDRNPFCTQIMAGVFEETVREKYNLMLHTAVSDDWHSADERALTDPRVDGLLLILPLPDSSVVRRCQQKRFPCVALVYTPDAPDIPAVNADDFAGGALATRHLIALGHRRIAHLSGDPKVASTLPRLAGYRAALTEAGIAVDPTLIVEAGFSDPGGREAMTRLLDLPPARRPTALFAANDLCADGALRVLRERGQRVPDDMAVVGYDDTWFAAMTHPPLTSVHMPISEMGMRATQMLIAQVEGRPVTEFQPVLPVTLTVRESCGAVFTAKEK